MHMPGFIRWLDLHLPADCFRAQTLQVCIACSLRKVRLGYWSGASNPTNEINNQINLEAHLGCTPTFSMINDYDVVDTEAQQDAAEFFTFLLHEMRKDFPEGAELYDIPDAAKRQYAAFDKLFAVQTWESWPCEAGNGRRHCRLNPLAPVPIIVSIASNQSGDMLIDQPLEVYVKEHFLTIGAKRSFEPEKCLACSKFKGARDIKVQLVKAPEYLVFQLTSMSNYGEKVQSTVQLPLVLDLTQHMADTNGEDFCYKLTTNVGHIGQSMNAGHYIAATSGPDGQYYTISDDDVELQADSMCLQDPSSDAQPYLVTYERCSRDKYDAFKSKDIYTINAQAVTQAEQLKAEQEKLFAGQQALMDAGDPMDLDDDDEFKDLFEDSEDEVK